MGGIAWPGMTPVSVSRAPSNSQHPVWPALLPPGPEAVLWRGAVPGAGRARAAEPHRHGDPGAAAPGVASLHHGGQLGRGQGPDRPRGDLRVHRQAHVRAATYRVTTILTCQVRA